jgi:hypothetical protein
MKRAKPKDDQGHKREPHSNDLMRSRIDECVVCHDVSLKTGQFRRPCPGEKHSGRYVGE